MSLSPKVLEALTQQINRELYSSYLYAAMTSYCETQNFKGFANWLTIQAQEEREHAQKLIDHLHDRGCQVRFDAIAAPPHEFESMVDVFSQALSHETQLAEDINKIYDLAVTERDYPAQILLQW